jgi:DNA-binding CsgD family transcriptional regulator
VEDPIVIAVELWSRVYGLTAREAEILLVAARGGSHTCIEGHFGLTRETVKKHVHNLIAKTQDDGLVHAAQRLLLEILEPPTRRKSSK